LCGLSQKLLVLDDAAGAPGGFGVNGKPEFRLKIEIAFDREAKLSFDGCNLGKAYIA
jgi:hypothetical protein